MGYAGSGFLGGGGRGMVWCIVDVSGFGGTGGVMG